MKKIINTIIYFLDSIIPKKKDYIIFSSYPDISDNSYAMFKYLYFNQKDDMSKYIWLVSDIDKKEQYKNMLIDNMSLSDDDFKNIIIVKKKSIQGLFYYMVSKYVFFTHGLFPRVQFPKNHILVNLWHGMPLKKIAYLLDDSNQDVPKSTFTVSTSLFFKKYMQIAFKQYENEVLVCGQPRNDLLFEDNKSLKKLGINQENYKKIFLWTPTFRQALVGYSLTDGEVNKGLPIIGEKYEELNQYLYKTNSYMIIKLHPMDILNNNQFDTYSNLSILTNHDLENNNCQFYSLVGEVDALLTDFSSIYIDYLLLNRPLGFVIDDLEQYAKSRGFILDDPINYMPGQFISSSECLYEFIDNCINEVDNYIDSRKNINQKFNIIESNYSECVWNSILKGSYK